jgi:hypothetical protein
VLKEHAGLCWNRPKAGGVRLWHCEGARNVTQVTCDIKVCNKFRNPKDTAGCKGTAQAQVKACYLVGNGTTSATGRQAKAGPLLMGHSIGSPVGGPHSLGEIRGAAAVNVLSRLFAFAFAAHGGALGQERR